MARAATKPIEGEYVKPDAEAAIRIYKRSIAPKLALIAEKRGDLSEPWKEIKETANFPKPVLELIFRLDGMEDAKRDHWLLAIYEGLKALKIHLPSDLVTQAQDIAGDSIIPTSTRERPRLVTVGDGTETDLVDASEVDEFDAADPALQAAE